MFLFSICHITPGPVENSNDVRYPSCLDGEATAQFSQLGRGGVVYCMSVIFGNSMDRNSSKFLSPNITYL